MVHELKIWPTYYWDVFEGRKTFEVRYNDRDYKVGDTLVLKEYSPTREEYTDWYMVARVTYLLSDSRWLQPGMVILGIKVLDGGKYDPAKQ
jgi:hypothetical protein